MDEETLTVWLDTALLMLGGFVRANLHRFTDTDLDELEAVLELPDAPLADWLTGRAPIPPEDDSPMLRRIRDSLING